MVCEYEYDEETQKMRVNCLGCIYSSSLEDSDVCMAKTIEKLIELKRLVRIVLAETREHEYDFNESKLLMEIANALERIEKERIISLQNVVIAGCDKCVNSRYRFLQELANDIKYDPIESYKSLKREIRHVKVKLEREMNEKCRKCYEHYMNNVLLKLTAILENCKLIQLSMDRMSENKDRSLYREFFHPSIRPNFMYTRFVSMPPKNAELLERYKLGTSIVEIYKIPGKVRKLYHLIPPEFRLSEDEYTILDTARRYIGGHEPRDIDLEEPERVRENLFRIGTDMIRDLVATNKLNISSERVVELANILTRYTAGLGILELFLEDENIQDIAVNSPVGKSPVYIYHGVYQECETNIVPSLEDAESWATRFRLRSGRPLDEANPVLDTELSVPGGRARVAAITRTLSPDGLGFAFRRHRDKPWTFPLFIKNKMIDSFSAGLIWFLIDGARTMLIAGTRSSGKSSFLGACMVQIMPKLRSITVEDTLELPVEQLRDLGYNIERLKSRSVITNVETELPAEEALRAALRLGDSCLIVGEVRSRESLALYEAMRIGALANVVAGTIHGDSAYGVFDRVVNDLGVPPTSFKATDIVVVCNMLRSSDGLHSFRRITSITEVRKHWKSDPEEEGGFVELAEYSSKDDVLRPTKTLLTGESQILNDIAYRVKEWKGEWDAVWDNLNLRKNILQALVDRSKIKKNNELLEATFVMQANSQFHLISDDVREEIGALDSKMIFQRWLEWLEKNS